MAQILNLVPYIYLIKDMEIADAWVVFSFVAFISFIGGILVLLILVLSDVIMVRRLLPARTVFFTSLIVFPVITFIVASAAGHWLNIRPTEGWQFSAIPAIAVVIAFLIFRKDYLPVKGQEPMEFILDAPSQKNTTNTEQ